MSSQPEMTIVIPTIFGRPEYIIQTFESAKDVARILDFEVEILVAVEPELLSICPSSEIRDHVLPIGDGGIVPLAKKINMAFSMASESSKILTWIGDDDLLIPEGIKLSAEALSEPKTVMTFGKCSYINQSGARIGKNSFGSVALGLLSIGPNLIPQPGSLWNKEAYYSVGGVPEDLTLAFDYELYFRLRSIGRIVFVDVETSCFRWHASSQSVSNRLASAIQSSRVRFRNRSLAGNIFLLLFEPFVILATWLAGKLVSFLNERKELAT